MKYILIQTIAVAALILGSLSGAHAADLDKAQIEAVLKTYEHVLNASDVDGVVNLYTRDGVFMAQHNPSAVGIEQVEAAYTGAFQAIDLNVEFDIVRPGQRRSMPRVTESPKATRSCSLCKRSRATGRLRATVFPPPIRGNKNIDTRAMP
jgi:hypothetical protein